MWERIFDKMMRRLIKTGLLHITYPDGTQRHYGNGSGLDVSLTIHNAKTIRALTLSPDLALGEAYMDARITVANDAIEDLIRLVLRNKRPAAFPAWVRVLDRTRFHLRHRALRNTAKSAKANVAHHYDISDDFYRMFLDDDMQYSCAYFTDDTLTLEQAQAAKKAHIAAKLRLKPDLHVLDIGCGWGGMALTLARDFGVRVTGVTLSENQLATARARANAANLSDRITFRLMDYRNLDGPFDRIVSVGMLEHVGLPHYADYFTKISALLAPDGVALIHTIGRCAPPAPQSRWMQKYIFPGGYIPALSELAPAMEASGLWSTDIEIWRLHYAKTLRHWRTRFDTHRDSIAQIYDDRFIRMWRYYLTACILGFEEQHQAVFHLQMSHRRDAVPLTRSYLYEPTHSPERRTKNVVPIHSKKARP
jgi:cyclopropane-fatty-acyl-phospholipid synthase